MSCPLHVHIKMRDNQRSGTRLAAYCAKFQCISKESTDQRFTEYCSTNCATRAFQSCKISCQGRDQSVAAGGPTTRPSSFRNTTSTLLRSFLKIARCPAAKQATGVITVSKFRSLLANNTCRSVKIQVKSRSKSSQSCSQGKPQSRSIGLHEMTVKLLEDGNQHLHDGTLQDGASTRAICVEKHGREHPPSLHHEFVPVVGVGPELLKSSIFTLNVKPTSASDATSSSNKRHALSNVVQNTSMSSA